MARILIVEDDPDHQLLLKVGLSGRGYELAFATDGHAALGYVNRHPVDLIVTDVLMPGMDGLELIQRLRSCAHAARIPILALTARALTTEVSELSEAGAHAVLTKPYEFAELRRVVARLIEGSRRNRRMRSSLAFFPS